MHAKTLPYFYALLHIFLVVASSFPLSTLLKLVGFKIPKTDSCLLPSESTRPRPD